MIKREDLNYSFKIIADHQLALSHTAGMVILHKPRVLWDRAKHSSVLRWDYEAAGLKSVWENVSGLAKYGFWMIAITVKLQHKYLHLQLIKVPIWLSMLTFDITVIVHWYEVDNCSNQNYEYHSRSCHLSLLALSLYCEVKLTTIYSISMKDCSSLDYDS